jgi:hypothetical protein
VVLTLIAVPSFNQLNADQRRWQRWICSLPCCDAAAQQNADVTVSPDGTWAAGWAVAVDGANIDTHGATSNIAISDPGVVTYRSSGRIAGTTQPKFSVSTTQTATRRCVKVNLSGEPVVTNGACS